MHRLSSHLVHRLGAGQVVVHLHDSAREKVRFNLKHDKRHRVFGARDMGRTPRIGHGDIVSGDAHNWPGFGRRIYLGERRGSDQHGFDIARNGFYVDLVLVK